MSTLEPHTEKSNLASQQQDFRSLAENTPDNIARWDTEGRYLYINPVHEKTLGMSVDEAVGTHIPNTHTEVISAIKRVSETGESVLVRQVIATENGEIEYHNVNLVPERDASGNIISILGVGRNMTQLYRLQDELAAREEEYRTLTTNSPDHIIRLDTQGRYLYLNPIHERTLGMPACEIIGRPKEELFPEHTAVLDAVEQIVETGEEEITVIQPVPGENGEMEIHEVKLLAEKNTEGEIVSILGIGRDITERKQQEERLHKTKAKLAAVITTIPDLIWVKDAEGTYIMCNPSFVNFFGASEDEIIGKTDYDFFKPDAADVCKLSDLEAITAGTLTLNYETFINPNNGIDSTWEIRKIPVYNGDEFMGILGIGRDITERKQMESEIIKQKEFQNTLLLSIAEAGLGVHVIEDGKYIYTNDIQKAKKYGYDETIVEVKPNFLDTIHPDDRAKALDMYTRRLRGEDVPSTYELGVVQTDGTRREHSVSVIVIPNTDPIQTIIVTQDISERKAIEKKVEFLAHHDALTGLPNRILAKDRTEQIIAHAKRTGSKAAILFIDLDGFKSINDSMGHSVGDAVLKNIASRLMEGIRASDTISRQGGDEFLLILSDIEEANNIITIAEKLLQEFDKPFTIAGQALSISASIGIALYPENGESFEALLQSADTAMYQAKESGKNTYCFYTQQMNHNLIGQFKLQNDLRSALQNTEFVLFYQPQIDLAENRITGAEALIRWQHPQMGMIPPMSFIPLAESSGIIVQIGEWVIHEACHQAAQWEKEGKEITVAVNISAVQFKRGNLEAIVKNALESSGLNPKLLELELTESILINDVENILKTVQILKGLGIQLSIDDFGTGYSSLAYLKRFAVDKLKIDQSFVREILTDQEDAAIVKTIIQMAKSLNLKTIAEGVEDAQVLAVVDSYGCDEVQGYHFAKPMEAKMFELYYESF
ncbi:EAL domain-containing protein [Sulfuricurvum sp.]|uniref:EAL domain-containing protein n=1 Tax=Sulfuricurvum sp. TaxID=2025608 RepID=UPI00356701FE